MNNINYKGQCNVCNGAILSGEGVWSGKVCSCPTERTDTNYLDVGCPACGHVPKSEKHLCDTTPETEGESRAEIRSWSYLFDKYDYKPFDSSLDDLDRILDHRLAEHMHQLVEGAVTSRDTYWKEQLQKAREEEKEVIKSIIRVAKNSAEVDRIASQRLSDLLDHSELEQDKK